MADNHTGISEIAKEELKITLSGDELRIIAYDGGATPIVDGLGRLMGNAKLSNDKAIDISRLLSGVYLVKTGNYTGKFVKE